MNEKSSGSRSRKQRLTAVGTRCAGHVTPLYPQKLALTSPTGGGRSVGIVRVRTKATEFSLVYLNYDSLQTTCTVRVEPLNKSEDGRGSKLRGPVKNTSLFSLLYVGHHFFLFPLQEASNQTSANLYPHTTLQPNVFLTGTYRVTGQLSPA